MKVSVDFDIDNLEELEKINNAIKQVVSDYSVKLDIDSSELNSEEENGDKKE